ncbi:MAG: DUF1552 domain-containing protein [Polyangiaceae bacterium]
MATWRNLSRRTLLRGVLGGAVVSIGLPWLEAFEGSTRSAKAGGDSGFPTRFGLFFWGNGNIPSRWTPLSEGPSWKPSEQLAPLADLVDEVSVVTGMRIALPNSVPHFAGAAGILSGGPLLDQYGENTFSLPSIDQVVANTLGELTRFRSLELGALPGDGLSFSGPNTRNPPESSPHALFERVFGTGFTLPGDTPIVDPTLAVRRSILDAVMSQISDVQGVVGASDKARLDQHLEGIRALEKRLQKLQEDPPNLASCAYAPEPLADYPDIEGRPQLQQKNKAMADIVAYALACDQTRVFSDFFTYPVNNTLFTGSPAGHHQLTHDEAGDQPEVNKIVIQCIEAFAQLVTSLKAIPEGDATLLDHCALLCTSDVSLGKTHSFEDVPLLIAGSASGKLRKGIHYHSPASENASKVMLSVIRAVGVTAASFGAEEGKVEEGLSAIEV